MLGRRRSQTHGVEAADLGLPETPDDLLVGRHLLLVPATTGVEVVADLLRQRQPDSDLTSGRIDLGRHASLAGPYRMANHQALRLGVPAPWVVCYTLDCTPDRDDPLPESVPARDRDGLTAAFPGGLPLRDEAAAVRLMIAVARRVGGAVRMSGSGVTVRPDAAAAATTVTIHSPHWLTGTELCTVLGDRVGLRLEADSDVAVAAVCGAPAGLLSVQQRKPDGPVGSVRDQWWADPEVVVSLTVRWEPDDPAPYADHRLDPRARRTRDEAASQVRRAAVALVEATKGVAVDEAGFRLDRYAL